MKKNINLVENSIYLIKKNLNSSISDYLTIIIFL